MPQFWVVAGPNGAGKTTIADRWLSPKLPVISPDSIARDREVSPVTAGRIALVEQRRHLSAGASFGIDTTFSGKREVELMKRALSIGYKVNFVFVCVDSVEICLARVFERVLSGGHSVPPNDVIRRFGRSLANLGDGIRSSHRAFLLDNTSDRRRLLLSIEHGLVKHLSGNLPTWVIENVPNAYLTDVMK